MKKLFTLALMLVASFSFAGPVNNIENAWEYVNKKNQDHRWFVISAENGSYVQCINMGDFVRCPFPMWVKLVPNSGDYYSAVEFSDKSYPEVAGSIKKEYAAYSKYNKIRKFAEVRKIEHDNVYSRLENKKGTNVGTGFDFVLVFDLSDSTVPSTIKSIFLDVFEVQNLNKLSFEFNN